MDELSKASMNNRQRIINSIDLECPTFLLFFPSLIFGSLMIFNNDQVSLGKLYTYLYVKLSRLSWLVPVFTGRF